MKLVTVSFSQELEEMAVKIYGWAETDPENTAFDPNRKLGAKNKAIKRAKCEKSRVYV